MRIITENHSKSELPSWRARSKIGDTLSVGDGTITIIQNMIKTYGGISREVVGFLNGEYYGNLPILFGKQTGVMLESSWNNGLEQSVLMASEFSLSGGAGTQSITLIPQRQEVSTDSSQAFDLTAFVNVGQGTKAPDGTPVYFYWFDVSSQDLTGAKVNPENAKTKDGKVVV